MKLPATEPFDFIVVGAGSSGCVLAKRLSADPKTRVLLLEAGPEPTDPWIGIPAGMAKLFAPGPRNWGYMSEPEPYLAGRRLYWPRGKGLGGSSAINGMLYVRGHPLDYDRWRQLGNTGWGWDDMLPLFKRGERNQHGESAMHGGRGELAVSDLVARRSVGELFVEAAMAEGFPLNADFNDGGQDGVGFLQFTTRNGRRCSSYEAFVKPIRHRPNLTILTEAQVERVEFEARRAVGVRFRRQGERVLAPCDGEIILCGGVINSPQLLMLSGVGPGEHLREMGLDVMHDAPGVGRNLHDHIYLTQIYNTPAPHSLNPQALGLRKYVEGAKYVLARKGVLADGAAQATLMARVTPGADQPDVQVVVRPYSYKTIPGGGIEPRTEPGVTVSVCQLRPESRGAITLKSPDIIDPPAMVANYLESPVDVGVLVAGVTLMRRIMASPILRGEGFTDAFPIPDDDKLVAYLRKVTGPVYHPVGTCKMGSDPMAVVDAELRVRGVEGLRVADASIMPTITSGNTNAPCIVIGEKAADLILESRGGARLR